jgi:hypothetical protein
MPDLLDKMDGKGRQEEWITGRLLGLRAMSRESELPQLSQWQASL